MKKIVLCFCLCFIVACGGYEPLFSSKNVSFYIKDVQNLNGDKISSKIIEKLKSFRKKINSEVGYNLRIDSKKNEVVASKNSKGDPLVYKLSIKTSVNVILDGKSIDKITLKESFNYNNTTNKFDLNQYKKNIEENLINKITEELTLRLQNL